MGIKKLDVSQLARVLGRRLLGPMGMLLLMVAPAHADYIYEYTGAPFAGIGSTYAGHATGIYSLTDRITGTVVIDDGAMLTGGARSTLQDAPRAYSFTDGHQTLTEQNSTLDFHVTIHMLGEWSDYWLRVLTRTSGLEISNIADNEDRAWLDTSSASEIHPHGSWTVTHTVPEPATGLLLALGVGMVGVMAWRR